MNKINDIYEKVYDFENLHQAYLEARKGKRYRHDVLAFSKNLEENLIQLQNELIWDTYSVGRYREFYVYDPKKRLIMALDFRDRVIQWAIYRQLNPILDKQFISDSYGCRKDKGTHKAAQKLQYWLRKADRSPNDCYYLKLDISKYFYRVDHDVLVNILKTKIEDEKLLNLLEKIIRSEKKFGLPPGLEPHECSYTERPDNRGMPIGNLTSQMFANLYLNELDQFCKHVLKIKRYVRYMDDVIILDSDKAILWQYKNDIESFLNNTLKLDLNNKTAVRPIESGVEFVGFRIWPTHVKLKKKSAVKIKHKLKIVQRAYSKGEITLESAKQSLASYLGIMEYFNSYNYKRKVLRNFVLVKSSEPPK